MTSTVPAAKAPPATADSYLQEGCEHERRGRVAEAQHAFELAIAWAGRRGGERVLAEALRRLANVHRRRHELDEALRLCRHSYAVATAAGETVLAAEALNGVALVHFARGEWTDARARRAEPRHHGERGGRPRRRARALRALARLLPRRRRRPRLRHRPAQHR